MSEQRLESFEKIGPTAWMVAYRRTFTDIPLSQEIFDEVERIRRLNGEPDLAPELKRPESAPQFEARYKLVDRLLAKNGASQVLELAAGLSPRGLDMADKGIDYVEVDLPSVMKVKRSIAEKLQAEAKVGDQSSLHLENGNVLDVDDLTHAVTHFDHGKPVAIINEGLMRYLDFDQKATLARNIHTILNEFGGVWITPDISIQKTQENEDKMTTGHVARISKMTGVDIAGNRFKSAEEAKEFFENLGFDIESHSFLEVTDELSSVERLNTSHEQLMQLNGDAVVFVMKPRA